MPTSPLQQTPAVQRALDLTHKLLNQLGQDTDPATTLDDLAAWLDAAGIGLVVLDQAIDTTTQSRPPRPSWPAG